MSVEKEKPVYELVQLVHQCKKLPPLLCGRLRVENLLGSSLQEEEQSQQIASQQQESERTEKATRKAKTMTRLNVAQALAHVTASTLACCTLCLTTAGRYRAEYETG